MTAFVNVYTSFRLQSSDNDDNEDDKDDNDNRKGKASRIILCAMRLNLLLKADCFPSSRNRKRFKQNNKHD